MEANTNQHPTSPTPNSSPVNHHRMLPPSARRRKQNRFALLWVVLTCVLLIASILLTYTLTAAAKRREYTDKLLAQQQELEQLKGENYTVAQNLQLLNSFLELYSYYADTMNSTEMMEAALKAYVAATGDDYASFYTQEEFAAMQTQNSGDYCGIGVTVINTTVSVNGSSYKVFRVTEINEGSSATEVGIRIGDNIYAVERNGAFETVQSLDYDQALLAVRGEEGTTIGLKVFREENGVYSSLDFSVVRRKFVTRSVRSSLLETDHTVGIVSISSFDLTTPAQFKEQINSLLQQGVEHFIFDVRNNPGGDLQSIKAVLSYFLQEGDLILSAIDKDEKVAASYKAEVSVMSDEYAACNVSKEEIGMYADLDMVVLCNEHTASAAEVFTATLRDYGLAKTVGQKTFGKGIMQTTVRVPFRDMVGYVKLTTHAYVTKCGVSYHGIGILPDVGVELSEEAKQYSLLLLPQNLDQQLQSAALLFS